MFLEVDPGFDELYALAFEEFSLERSVGLADEDFSAFADDAMPGNSFAGRSGGHGPARGARAPGKAQSPSEGSVR